jgi:hypothetical protein
VGDRRARRDKHEAGRRVSALGCRETVLLLTGQVSAAVRLEAG